MRAHETDPIGDGSERKGHKFISQTGIDFDHGLVRRLRFGSGLFSFGVLYEDGRPVGCYEDKFGISTDARRPQDRGRHRQAAYPQITYNIRNASIEDDRPIPFERLPVGSHLPCQHRCREGSAIRPGQGGAAGSQLVLYDGSAGFRHSSDAIGL